MKNKLTVGIDVGKNIEALYLAEDEMGVLPTAAVTAEDSDEFLKLHHLTVYSIFNASLQKRSMRNVTPPKNLLEDKS